MSAEKRKVLDLASVVVSVAASAEAVDGYGVSSLSELNEHGFLAEQFIKPPVDLTLVFDAPVQVVGVLINPCVRSHASQFISILVSSKKEGDQTTFNLVGRAQLAADCPAQTQLALRIPLLSQHDLTSLIAPTNAIVSTFDSHLSSLRHVVRLTIRIHRVFESKLIAVGGIRVWGHPSEHLPYHEQERLIKLCSTPSNINPTTTSNHDQSDELIKKHQDEDHIEDVPCGFLDELTFELMNDPVILPSGKVVDRSTIERHFLSSKSMSDPFTGVPITRSRLLPATVLRQQIEAFRLSTDRLSAPSVFGGVGQTVGTANNDTIKRTHDALAVDARITKKPRPHVL